MEILSSNKKRAASASKSAGQKRPASSSSKEKSSSKKTKMTKSSKKNSFIDDEETEDKDPEYETDPENMQDEEESDDSGREYSDDDDEVETIDDGGVTQDLAAADDDDDEQGSEEGSEDEDGGEEVASEDEETMETEELTEAEKLKQSETHVSKYDFISKITAPPTPNERLFSKECMGPPHAVGRDKFVFGERSFWKPYDRDPNTKLSKKQCNQKNTISIAQEYWIDAIGQYKGKQLALTKEEWKIAIPFIQYYIREQDKEELERIAQNKIAAKLRKQKEKGKRQTRSSAGAKTRGG